MTKPEVNCYLSSLYFLL